MSRYTFESTTPASVSHKRGDDTDGNGSLSYSAASSIQSTGESSDSSFADIMKVLDDSKDIAAFIKKNQPAAARTDEKSVAAESLAYSTDAESHIRSLATDAESKLQGTDLIMDLAGPG